MLGPRVLPVLTFAAGAALMYGLMRPNAQHSTHALDTRAEDAGSPAGAVLAPEPASDAGPASTPRPSLTAAPEPRSDAGAERTDAGSGPAASVRDQHDTSDTSDFDDASTAYQSGAYEDAITALREHARKYPKSRHAVARDRLLTLALIRAGHKTEARERIEALRRANPQSPTLAEFDAAFPPEK